jgi:hypothetical protein
MLDQKLDALPLLLHGSAYDEPRPRSMTTGEFGLKYLVLGDGATSPIGLDDRVSGVKNLTSVSIVGIQP